MGPDFVEKQNDKIRNCETRGWNCGSWFVQSMFTEHVLRMALEIRCFCFEEVMFESQRAVTYDFKMPFCNVQVQFIHHLQSSASASIS